MRARDRREHVLTSALNSATLTPREKLFIVVVTTIAPEYVDGARRHGSKAMAPDGKFALHLDYLARALGTTAGNVKKIRAACQSKGHLGHVHDGTFGRPSTWQGQVVRGDETYGVTFRQIVPPYGDQDPPTRGPVTSPLVYKGAPVGAPAADSPSLGRQAADEEDPRWQPFGWPVSDRKESA